MTKHTPRIARAALSICLVSALCATSCSLIPRREDSQSSKLGYGTLHSEYIPGQEDDENQAGQQQAHAYGPPLPAEASVEKPGENQATAEDLVAPEGSIRPDDREAQDRIPKIYQRGKITVGVDQSLYLTSYRDPQTGELRGFEVDLAREIARDIFGDPDAVDFHFVESVDRLSAISDGEVDMVIRTMPITANRQQSMSFSTPYLSSATRLLVADQSGIEGIDDLAGHTVCVADGSASLHKARKYAPDSTLIKTRNWSDCLVAVQQHQADAILSDDTMLSGINAQDPYTQIVGPALDHEYYGVAVHKATDEESQGLVMQINSTIERVRSEGTWWRMWDRWFSSYLSTDGPPALDYSADPNRVSS